VEKCKTEENLSKFLNNMAYIRLWLLWGIVLWKESLCKTLIVFILIKCICFIIKINHVWSRVKNIALKKNIVFPKNPLFYKKNPLFSNMCTFLSHCFETKNYHWLESIEEAWEYLCQNDTFNVPANCTQTNYCVFKLIFQMNI